MFDVDSWMYGKNKQWKKSERKNFKSIPVISGITVNNGVNYYTDDLTSEDELFQDSLTISTRGEYSGTVTYHKGKFVLANNILVMSMKNLTEKQKIFIGSLINTLDYGGYSNYPRKDTLKHDIISLPTKNGKIDFEFMESFVAELEAQRVTELEAQRVTELEAYLTVTGLKDYELTEDEKNAIDMLDTISWKEENIMDIFDVNNTKSILSRDVIFNSGSTPYLCASRENNSIASYIEYSDELKDKGDCIFIGGKTFVVTYQDKDFYSNDSHNLALYLKEKESKSKTNQLFLLTCIRTALSHLYSWGNSISKQKIKNNTMLIPMCNNCLNINYMETLIRAVQKLVIKDVVCWADKKVEATMQVIEEK